MNIFKKIKDIFKKIDKFRTINGWKITFKYIPPKKDIKETYFYKKKGVDNDQ